MTGTFRTTQWTQVLAARGEGPEARQALSDLCAAYYEPIVRFLRASIREDDRARDLAHEFFAGVLDRHGFSGADPRRGRFRTYLLGAVKHFLANHLAAQRSAKRGGGAIHEPFETLPNAHGAAEIADPHRASADLQFDREWALNLLDRALAVLQCEAQAAGQSPQFEALKPWLTGDCPTATQASVAHALGLSEGAVRVAIHRLRRRFRDQVKAEILQTVADPAEAEAELRHLIAVLG